MPPTLHDLQARGFRFEWFEAVAVVQAVAAEVLDGEAGDRPGVPGLDQLAIGDDGGVLVSGRGAELQSTVFQLGNMLATLIGEQPIPVSLRLFALNAVAPSPPYASVRAFSDALEYHERPRRTEVLKQLYARIAATPFADAPDVGSPEMPVAPAVPASPERSWRWRRRAVALVAVASTAVVVAGAIVALNGRTWWTSWRVSGATEARRAVQSAAVAVKETVAAGFDAVRERLTGTSGAVTPAPPPPEPQPPVARVSRAVRRPLSTGSAWMRPEVTAAYAVPEAVATDAAVLLDDVAVLEVPPLAEPDEWRVYSSDDPDVAPPVAVHPKLPSDPPPGVSLDAVPRLELIVSRTGDVERVRLLTPPPDVRTSMLLSAAKAWVFEPATRSGRTVRYRMVVRLTTF